VNVAGRRRYSIPLDEALEVNAFGSAGRVGPGISGDVPLLHT